MFFHLLTRPVPLPSFHWQVGAMPRREGMERSDLLAKNIKIFQAQGASINRVAKKSVKVLVVGNPANTNALICSRFAPTIPKSQFTSLTQLDQVWAEHVTALAWLACWGAVDDHA